MTERIKFRPVKNPYLRWLIWGFGTLALILGIVGLILPVLPTTPFMLVAAACYARSSRKFLIWMTNNPIFGPTIVEFYEHRRIPLRAKIWATSLLTIMLGTSIILFIPVMAVKLLLAGIGVAVLVYIWSFPH